MKKGTIHGEITIGDVVKGRTVIHKLNDITEFRTGEDDLFFPQGGTWYN